MSKSKFSEISIEGAKTNNLKNIYFNLPLNRITCIYGPSGSGKSSLAFGTLVDESKRRYLNSLPNDLKFLWNIPPSADVDKIEPVLPVWALAQINPVVGSRPVVSDLLGITELVTRHFYLNGEFFCSHCGGKIVRNSFEEMVGNFAKKLDKSEVLHFFVKKEHYLLLAPGATAVRSTNSRNSKVYDFNEGHKFWEVSRARVKSLGNGVDRVLSFLGSFKTEVLVKIAESKKTVLFKGEGDACEDCGEQFNPSDFSNNNFNPLVASGACVECDGFGQTLDYDLSKIVKNESLTLDEGAIPLLTYKQFSHLLDDYKKDLRRNKIKVNIPFGKMPKKKWKLLEKGGDYFCGLEDIYDFIERKKYKRSMRILSRRLKTERECTTCSSTRLKEGKLTLNLNSIPLRELLGMELEDAHLFFNKFKGKKDLSFKKLLFTLKTARELNLSHIFLNRKVKSLSSGEYQRLLLVKILSQEGTGMLFALDEPSRGLSFKEQSILMAKLGELREQGNTVVIVDHSEFIREKSDNFVEMGPGAGSFGGEIISHGKTKKTNTNWRPKKVKRKAALKSFVEFGGVEILNRKYKKIKIPLNEITWVTGDSGSGKTLFFKHVFFNHLEWEHTGLKTYDLSYEFEKFHTTNVIEKVNYFDPELRTASSRSTVGTYLGFSDLVRKHYSKLPVSEALALDPGCFSPNSELGKCSTCEGRGELEIDMQFLENLTIKCEDCDGKKLKQEYSSISDGNYTVFESYNYPMNEVLSKYKLTPKFQKLFEYTKLLKLSHLSFSRTLKSLSGGERLRLQFLKNLNFRAKREIFIFDNLSIGLSSNELEGISAIIKELITQKNTVIVIDSNPYFSDMADFQCDFNTL